MLYLTRTEDIVGDLLSASLAWDNSPSDRVGDRVPLSILLSGECKLSSTAREPVLRSGLSNVSEYE